jgi:hypothetical protein
MNRANVRSIIETTLKSGNRTPGLFDLPKIIRVKSKLESCDSVGEVIGILEDNRYLISKSFGLSDSLFDGGVEKLKTLEAAV